MLRTFLTGSLLYPVVELCYRGRTHPAMALAGGTALCTLRGIYRRHARKPLWKQSLLGGLWITGIEYVFGLVFNRHYRIWDYRKIACNWKGHVCLPYTLAWCGLSFVALAGMRVLNRLK